MTLLIETSALIAIVTDEPERPAFLEHMAKASHLAVPASCYLEAAMVLGKRHHGKAKLDELVSGFAITFIPLDEPIARVAADAFPRYGRGTGHRPRSISATAYPTRRPCVSTCPCCSRATTSGIRT